MPQRLMFLTFMLTTGFIILTCAACARDSAGRSSYPDRTPVATRPDIDASKRSGGEASTAEPRLERARPYAADRGVRATDDTDNTRRNVRDRDDESLTPMDQGGAESDRKLTAAIRRAIVKDDALSTNAHNVKIITRGGAVTLRGPVDSAAEKAQLEQLALKVRGVKRVDNQLDVTAP